MPLVVWSAPLFHESLKSPVHRGLVFPLCLRWDMRLGGSYWCCRIGCGFLNQLGFSPASSSSFKQSGKNVVIKFVCLWGGGGPCSGSWLNLCAASKSPAYNSSTDEQNTDLSTAEVPSHQFVSGCRVVGGITMATVSSLFKACSPMHNRPKRRLAKYWKGQYLNFKQSIFLY